LSSLDPEKVFPRAELASVKTEPLEECVLELSTFFFVEQLLKNRTAPKKKIK